MAFPTPLVDFSPGEGPFDTPTWVDVSADTLEFETTTGRQKDLSEFPPGEATILLRNEDRRYDPEHTTGPYYGLLNPRTPFRIRATSGSTYDLFYGFVEDGFEQEYHPPADAYCRVRLVDMFGVLATVRLPSGLYAEEVAADSPLAWYRLGDETTTATDSSGNNLHGTYEGGPSTSAALVVDTDGARSFDGTDDRVVLPTGASVSSRPFTIEAWIKLDTSASTQTVWSQSEGQSRIVVTSTGLVQVQLTGGGYALNSSIAVDDDQPHHVVVVAATADTLIYIDGVDATGTPLGSYPEPAGGEPVIGDAAWNSSSLDPFNGVIDEVAIYESALSSARIGAHYTAGTVPWDGDTTGERMERVLALAGLGSSMWNIDTGDTILGPAILGGDYVLDYMRKIAASEQGDLYVDHADGGKVRFRSRYARSTDTRSTVAQFTVTDADTPGAIHAENGSLRVEPNGISTIINQVTVNWADGSLTQDAASVATLGPKGVTVDTILKSATEAQALADYILTRYSTAQARVRGFELFPSADESAWPEAIATRIGDRVAVRRHPQSVGSAITTDHHVEGPSQVVADGRTWRSGFTLSPVPPVFGLWGTALWGSGLWGY